MCAKQLTTPLLLKGDRVRALQRVSFTEGVESEGWLQELLYRHVSLLPLAEIEPAAADSVPIAMEIPVGNGRLDLLYANSDGILTLVETKLWRNPEARRAVVAQIMEYASEMSGWNYQRLTDAIRSARAQTGKSFVEILRAVDEQFDESRFVDAVSRNLMRGRFLLMIVGDGIQEGLEQLADFLQRVPHLGFSLALVEIGLFRMGESGDSEILVQPRILSRTREVVRAIVEISSGVNAGEVKVSLPTAATTSSSTSTITETILLEKLAQSVGAPVTDSLRWLLQQAPGHQLKPYFGKRGVTLYYDNESGYRFHLGRIDDNGDVVIYSLFEECEKLGLPDAVWKTYYEGIIRLVPGAKTFTFSKGADQKEYRQLMCTETQHVTLKQLAPKKEQWLEVIDATIECIRKAMEQRREISS